MFFKNKKAEQTAWALVALVAVVAVVGLVNMSSGGLTGNVPVKVFDISQSAVVGEIDVAAGNCKYLATGNLICPGTPAANTELCLESASTACGEDSTCILDTTQECVNAFGSLDISNVLDGSSCDQIATSLSNVVDRQLQGIPEEGPIPNTQAFNPCTLQKEQFTLSVKRLVNRDAWFRFTYLGDNSKTYNFLGGRIVIDLCADGRSKVDIAVDGRVGAVCSEI